jgi:hypothetical protein
LEPYSARTLVLQKRGRGAVQSVHFRAPAFGLISIRSER